jgi:hypothetical protein
MGDVIPTLIEKIKILFILKSKNNKTTIQQYKNGLNGDARTPNTAMGTRRPVQRVNQQPSKSPSCVLRFKLPSIVQLDLVAGTHSSYRSSITRNHIRAILYHTQCTVAHAEQNHELVIFLRLCGVGRREHGVIFLESYR